MLLLSYHPSCTCSKISSTDRPCFVRGISTSTLAIATKASRQFNTKHRWCLFFFITKKISTHANSDSCILSALTFNEELTSHLHPTFHCSYKFQNSSPKGLHCNLLRTYIALIHILVISFQELCPVRFVIWNGKVEPWLHVAIVVQHSSILEGFYINSIIMAQS